MSEKAETYWIYEYQGLTSVDNARYWKTIRRSEQFFELVMLSKRIKVSEREKCTEFRIVRKKYVEDISGAWLKHEHVLSEVMEGLI